MRCPRAHLELAVQVLGSSICAALLGNQMADNDSVDVLHGAWAAIERPAKGKPPVEEVAETMRAIGLLHPRLTEAGKVCTSRLRGRRRPVPTMRVQKS